MGWRYGLEHFLNIFHREATIFCAGVCSSVYKTFQSVDGIINPMRLSVKRPFLRTKATFQQVVSEKSPSLRTGPVNCLPPLLFVAVRSLPRLAEVFCLWRIATSENSRLDNFYCHSESGDHSVEHCDTWNYHTIFYTGNI